MAAKMAKTNTGDLSLLLNLDRLGKNRAVIITANQASKPKMPNSTATNNGKL